MHNLAIKKHFQPMAYAIIRLAPNEFRVMSWRSPIDARQVWAGNPHDRRTQVAFGLGEDIAVAHDLEGARATLPQSVHLTCQTRNSELWIRD